MKNKQILTIPKKISSAYNIKMMMFIDFINLKTIKTFGSYYPPPKLEGYRFDIVRPGVTNLLGYISKTIKDLNMKLQGCIYLIK